jgi:hypothetical protein
MTAAELIALVQVNIQDVSYTPTSILALLNRGAGQVAGVITLPLLGASSTVSTSITYPYVSLPADYMREVLFISSAKQKMRIEYFRSFLKFMKQYPALDQVGDVAHAAIRGSRLYYQPKPSTADTLTLHYQRNPVPMVLTTGVNDQTTPDGIPQHLQEPLLVSYACWKIWSEIEQDDGNQPNTNRHFKNWVDALGELNRFVGAEDGEPEYIEDEGLYA